MIVDVITTADATTTSGSSQSHHANQSVSIQKQHGWNGVTSEARVKCSVCCFQSNASAPPPSRCECSLTEVARIERDADDFFFFLFVCAGLHRSL